MSSKCIGIVGDFDSANEAHLATNQALRHCAAALRLQPSVEWVGTEQLTQANGPERLQAFSGLWIAPASPYRSTDGALLAIRTAREQRIPLLGTCGGFQHIVLEYARNVLGLEDARHEESDAPGGRWLISRLACSLYGRRMVIRLEPGSLLARLYGQLEFEEQYRCNFGVNPEYVGLFKSGALHVVASDLEGIVRAVEMEGHPFFVGTLFLPQLNSTAASPHPVVSGFLKAVLEFDRTP